MAFVPDLMDHSKVAAAVPGVTFVGSASALVDVAPAADVVVIDLSRPGVLDVLDQLTAVTRVIGFGSHVDRDILARADAAGCEALPRSAFFARLGSLLD